MSARIARSAAESSPSSTDSSSASTLLTTASEDEQIWYQIACVLSFCLTAVVILLIFFWRKCIRRAIAIVKECTKVFKSLPVIMVWPIQGLFFQLGFVLVGILMIFWCLDDDVWGCLGHVQEWVQYSRLR